eukprot:1557576-Pleurochrysis_carterae.AAC.1
MLENKDKREMLPLGRTAIESDQVMANTDTNEAANVPQGWKKRGETVLSLGIPHGNTPNFYNFLKSKYIKAKSVLARAKSVRSLTIVGQHKILNANYYGIFRYYMFSLVLPKWLNEAIEQDAYAFIWKGSPRFNNTTIGTPVRAGKFISKAATNRPISMGGAGCLNWKAHTMAFHARWIISYFSPRAHPWKEILTHWLPYPNSILVNATNAEKKNIIQHVPQGHHVLHSSLTAFWKLKLNMTRDSILCTPRDHLLAFPIFHNPLFKVRKNMQQEWNAHPKLATMLTLFRLNGSKRTQTEIRKQIKELAPNHNGHTVKRLLRHAKAIQGRIPCWFVSLISCNPRSWSDDEIVAMEDDEGELQFCQILKRKLYQLRLDASGH